MRIKQLQSSITAQHGGARSAHSRVTLQSCKRARCVRMTACTDRFTMRTGAHGCKLVGGTAGMDRPAWTGRMRPRPHGARAPSTKPPSSRFPLHLWLCRQAPVRTCMAYTRIEDHHAAATVRRSALHRYHAALLHGVTRGTVSPRTTAPPHMLASSVHWQHLRHHMPATPALPWRTRFVVHAWQGGLGLSRKLENAPLLRGACPPVPYVPGSERGGRRRRRLERVT